MRLFLVTTVAAIATCVGVAPAATGEIVPEWELKRVVFYADLIVQGKVSHGKEVTITEVIDGDVTVGKKLEVQQLGWLPKKRKQARDLRRDDDNRPSVEDEGFAIVFLERDAQSWVLSGYGSGVKWIVGERVYGYARGSTTGSYDLLPDAAGETPEEFRKSLQAAIGWKRRFQSAMSLADPAERVKALAEYVEPNQAREPTFDYARIEIGRSGPHGLPFLLAQMERPEQRPQRTSFLHAIGQSCDPSATDFLLKIVEKAAPVAKAIPRFDWKTASDEQRQAMAEWRSAISALEDQQASRALPAFRDAVQWGAAHWTEVRILEDATRGLEKLPDPDNIPVLAKALKNIPQDEFDWVAKERCVRALAAQQYPAAVPILADQLVARDRIKPGFDHDEYNSRIAHRALTEIVGRDLGNTKQPWLKWFAEQSKSK